MSYNDFLGFYTEPPEELASIVGNTTGKGYKEPEHDYDHVRFGLPKGALSFEREKDGRKILTDHFLSCGYRTWPSSKLNNNLKKHVALFRCHLDLWEALCGKGSMSKEEIYYRTLTEGTDFIDFVKKARSTSFRAATSETDTVIEEEYLLDNYKGYNSIIHERYLINWDASDETDDVKYAFLPSECKNQDKFRKVFRKMLSDFRINEVEFPREFDMVGALKNSVMHDPVKKKNILMRNFWNDKIDPNTPYYATRRVVPIEAGNVRDTGVGDPSTILKVKQLNMLARVISEHVPYCANAPSEVCNKRLKRVLKRNAFLHLDFKKFGLTFPRELQNIAIEEIGKVAGIDTSHLVIRDFFLEIDGDVYKTSSGTVLGWLDPISCLCVCAILHWLSCEEELGFDFISFNDDVEISKFCKSDLKGTLELLRLCVIAELNSYGIAISLDKTFGSRCSVFLERYAYYDLYDIDMYKEQLTVKAYAQSLVTKFPWQAKMYHSAAEMWTKSEYATDRCIKTCPVEFRLEEASMSLWSGGWFVYRKNKLDLSILECDVLGYLLGLNLAKYKMQNYSSRVEKTTPHDKAIIAINNRCYNAYSSEMGRFQFKDNTTVSEINSDIDVIKVCLDTYVDQYAGNNEKFVLRISWLAREALGMVVDPT